MNIYTQNIIDHYKNPRNKGLLSNPSVTHKEVNSICGDTLEIDIQIENNTISDIKFRGEGCAISQASISIITDEIKGMNVDEVLAMTIDDVRDMLGIEISERREKCAHLGLLAVQKAITTFQNK